MSDSSQFHRGFMALSCHFHVSFTAMSDSSRIHVTCMSLSTKQSSKQCLWMTILNFDNDNLELWKKVPWKFHESDMKVTWIWFTWAWQFWSGRKCHESPMNLPWKWHEMFGAMFFGVRHESDMNMTWTCYSGFRQFFMADSWHFHGTFLKNSKIVEIHHIIFISDSCRFHATFMALSWQPQKLGSKHFHTISMALSLKTSSKLSYIIFVSVCLSVVSAFFSSFDISLMVFQVDQSFLFWSKFFCFFFDQNIRL